MPDEASGCLDHRLAHTRKPYARARADVRGNTEQGVSCCLARTLSGRRSTETTLDVRTFSTYPEEAAA